MARLVDADALKQRAIRVSTVKEHCYMKAVGTREIDKAPTVDAVPVVRCKDCVSRVWDDVCEEYYCNSAYGICGAIDDNSFCSYGERKEEK